jgi:protein BCP1
MGKRKATDDKQPTKDKMDIDGEDSGSSGDDEDMLNVDFEWFSPNTDIDFHGLKTLLRQLFDVDNQLFDLSALTDLILAQNHIGSTVKCDGEESDPYAFLTIFNLFQHKDKPIVKDLIAYLLARSKNSSSPIIAEQLEKLLSPTSSAQVGLILTERFINMPHQIIPPLYTMLQSEISSALASNEPVKFTHYLLISKTYTEVASKLDAEDTQPSKKKKASAAAVETFYFHPEDEVLHRHAAAQANFDYEKQGEDGACG